MDEEVRWRVGVLRSGVENVDWVVSGARRQWGSARSATIGAVRELVQIEGRQEYRLQIGDVKGILNPGLDRDGRVVLGDIEVLIPSAPDDI